MSWLNPQWLWLLLPLGMALLYYINAEEGFGGRRRWLLLSALLVIVSLCRPVILQEPVEIETGGSDVIVAIDLSHSMQATDLKPTRLEAAKKLLEGMVRADREDRFGVIGFTTNAIVLSPLTSDSELLLHLFDALDEQMIITKGTVLMGALKLARKMSRSEHPKLLLLTDGGDALGYNEEEAFAKHNNLQVSVVMLATRGGSTLRESDGKLLKDEEGNIVVTARNDAIKVISDATGGAFIDGADLPAVLDTLKAQKEEDYRGKTKIMQYQELFYFSVTAALLAFMIAVTTLHSRIARLFGAALLLVGVGAQAGMLDAYHLYKAESDYRAGHFEKAAAGFGEVDDPRARYNAAASRYRAGEYEAALQLYQSIRSSDPAFKAALYFNIANCYIRLKEFEKAKEALRKSLALRHDEAAVENLYAISRAESQDHMLTGRQEGKERAQQAQSESESTQGKGKKSGGSNMDVSAAASGGSDSGGKKAKSDPRLSFSKSEGVVSSRQYELINQRSVHETKPW
jgi:Ca-activated chloride channel family protein